MNDIFGFQSGGGGGTDPALALRVTVLEDNELKITYYEIISGTSGSLTVPTNATINEGEFGLSGNAILSKIDGSNKPTFESPITAGGVVVTASLNATTGAWVSSGVYTDANVALIYSIKIKTVYYSNLNYNRIIDETDLSGIFSSNIVVSLSGGKTLGKYTTGQTIPAAGKTAEEVMNLIAIEDIAPTYTIPTITLVDTVTNTAEVGTSYSNTLTSTFTQNDAGTLSLLRIQKNGADITPNETTSPSVKSDSGTYPNGTTTYIAYADYGAGIIKNYTPSGTPDPRTPLVRSVNAPQAASTNFASSSVTITGYYKYFYGASASAPITSADVRALPSNQLTSVGNTFTLNTGTVERIFSICMPATKTLVSVIDADALNANVTANYILSTFNVNDAAGNAVSYKNYTMTNASPYASSHAHLVTIA